MADEAVLIEYSKDEIRGSLAYPLSIGDRYSLETFLPQCGDYDQTVNEYINKLEMASKNRNSVLYNNLAEELIEHYYINQEDYDFKI